MEYKREFLDAVKLGYIKDLYDVKISDFHLIKRLTVICNITSLNGIEQFTNLEYLNCGSNSLTSLKGIENLTNLNTLICSRNLITSFSPIKNLVNLEYLDCSQNRITTLKGLENLVNLNTLIVDRTLLSKLTDKHGKGGKTTRKGNELREILKLATDKYFVSTHLNKNDDLRGKAALMHSGLFDFNIN